MSHERGNVKISSKPGPGVPAKRPGKDVPERLHVLECRGMFSGAFLEALDGFRGSWREPPYTYLFFSDAPDVRVRRLIRRAGVEVTNEYSMGYRQWQQVADPVTEIGPFSVYWGTSPPETGPAPGIPIRLQSGLVFGSGMHPTTQASLLVLSRVFPALRPSSVVDLGTGTGILALACARLGAQTVVALDANPLAVQEAAHNVTSNGLQGVIHLLVGSGLDALKTFGDLLVMNLEWSSLRAVLEAGDWRRFSWVVVSGFLEGQWGGVRKLAEGRHRARQIVWRDGWGAAFFDGA